MNSATERAIATVHGAALQQFTHDFFTRFGATLSPQTDGPADAISVDLSPPLAAHFAQEHLDLCFHQNDIEHGELVAFGSRVYDQMLAFLQLRSALTVLTLPPRYVGGEELLAALRPVNAGITGLRTRSAQTHWIAFDWQIIYRADDKREELFTVVLDEDGTLCARRTHDTPLVDAAHDGALQDDVAGAGAAAPGPRSNGAPHAATSSMHRTIDDGQLVQALFTHGQPVMTQAGTAEKDTNGAETATPLPPLTQLNRLAEIARKYAIYFADLRCIDHEAEILPRLHKTLSRLTNYYGQQIEEVRDTHDPDGEKRRVLEADLQRKVAEEVENHRLRVQVNLLSYAIFRLPVARADITLGDGRVSTALTVERNLFTGDLRRPHCHACGEETGAIALDKYGHLTCDTCIRQCDHCQEILCAACGVLGCQVCGRDTCADCGQTCMACGARACAEHMARCPTCGDLVCLACQDPCAACGTHQCRSHLRRDTVTSLDADGTVAGALVCLACAIRCPGCQQYSAQLGLCAQSGQRFCRNCLHACHACGRTVGPGFYEIDPQTGHAICHHCALICPTCGAFAHAILTCSTCNADGCGTCMARCSACDAALCPEHAQRPGTCGHVICAGHQATCAIGGEIACPVCHTTCSVCDRPYCDEHRSYCKRCRQPFCDECVRLSGLCDICAHIDRDGKFVALVDEPCAEDPRVRLIMNNYRWLRLPSTHLIHYLGRDASMQTALIVVERAASDATTGTSTGAHGIRRVAKLGMLDTPYRDRWA